jgi:anti-sigma-K factor RskA
LYNPTTKAVYLDVRKLPAPPTGKQYQLWALDNGKPVDAGVLAAATTAGDSLQQMKDIASAQAFAMTVEPEGGSINPTLSTLTVVGNI